MKKYLTVSRTVVIVLSLVFSSAFLINCKNNRQDVYDRLMKHANSIKIIDTHEHQRKPSDYNVRKYSFYSLMMQDYLGADLVSAGSPGINYEIINNNSLDTLWNKYGKFLNYSMNTSYYESVKTGLRLLYDFKGSVFTRENIKSVSEQIAEKHKNYDKWFNDGFNKANYEIMFLDQYWDRFNCKIDTSHFALDFNIRNIVMEISNGPQKNSKGEPPEDGYYQAAKKENYTINTLDDYLTFADYLFQKNIKYKAVTVKSTLAYDRSLDYEDVPYEKAVNLFKSAPSISKTDKKALEDFMFHWIIKKSIQYNLPIQIHTGYFAGNGNTLKNGDPINLNNLFLRYPKAKFVLLHGGYPSAEEYILMGKMFPNVYLDLVWLPQISKQAAIRTFNEMFGCVPYNKIFCGAGDTRFIEGAVGALELGKEVIIQVLTERITEGSISEEVAYDVINRIFRTNAIDVYNLKEKLMIQ
jgi:uncharacterized protein